VHARVCVFAGQGQGARFPTSDCDASLECFSPGHHAVLVFTVFAIALVYFPLVLADRLPVNQVRVCARVRVCVCACVRVCVL
jgi:hypothetical protein